MSSAKHIYVGIDLGTTTLKIAAYDARDGSLLAISSRETDLLTPRPDWVEYEPLSYRQSLFDGMHEVVSQVDARQIGGISVSSQGQTFVILDEDDAPLRNMIVWLDNRAAREADELQERLGREFNSLCSGAKWLWIARNELHLWRRTRKVLMLPEYVTYLLTGERIADRDTAQSSLCLDDSQADYRPDALESCEVKRSWLGRVVPPGELIGRILPEVCEHVGVLDQPPVFAGTNDQLAGAVGVGNDTRGIVSGTIGTATALVANLGNNAPAQQTGFYCGRYPVQGQCYALTFGKTGANLLTWFRNQFAPARSYDEITGAAGAVPVGCAGLICLPHFQGVATPSYRADVRGAFLGVSLAHTQAHFARAVMEAVCFSALDSLELVRPLAGKPNRVILMGGAAKSEMWMQMMADVLATQVDIPINIEAATLGAAMLAAVGAGFHDNLHSAIAACVRMQKRFNPDTENHARYLAAYRRYRNAMEKVYPGAL